MPHLELKALKDETLIATCYYHLAILEAHLLQEASALDYFHKALSHYQQVDDLYSIPTGVGKGGVGEAPTEKPTHFPNDLGMLYQVEGTRTNIVALYVQLEQYEKVIEPAQQPLGAPG